MMQLTLSPAGLDKLYRHHGNFDLLIARLRRGSLRAATDVLFYALGKKDEERAQLERDVYAAGIVNLMPSLLRLFEGTSNDLANPFGGSSSECPMLSE